MGMGRLNVWIHDRNSPCRISDEDWLVNVSYCSGETLEWCGKTFGFLDAKCGHLEIEIPPGCYVVHALQWFWLPGSQFPFFRSTHFALVMVECDASACVHLYFPTVRQTTHQSVNVGRLLAEEGGVPREKAQQLAAAASSLLEHLPKTGHDEALERAAQDAAAKAKDKGK